MKRFFVISAVLFLLISTACSSTDFPAAAESQENIATSVVATVATLPNTSTEVEPTMTQQVTDTPTIIPTPTPQPTATFTTEPIQTSTPTLTPEPPTPSNETNQLSDSLPVNKDETTEKIAFSFIDDDDYDIYIMNTDGSNPVRLTDNPANEMYPIWSPNNDKIAYLSEQDGLWEVYIMNADGSNQTRLAEGKDPVWSPDDRQLAFVSQNNGVGEIYLINIDGSELRYLTDGFAPAWSPDGQKIAFETGGADSKIYVINVDGSNLKHVIDTAGGPVWSPDGNQIAFTSYYNAPPPKVYVVNADNSNLNRLADGAAPVWSPDGSQIAFLDISSLSDIRYTSYNVINADGTDQSIIISGIPQMRNILPSWSPDSQQIVVVSDRADPGPLGIDVVNVDGSGGYGSGSLTRLTDQSGFYAFPAWSSRQGETEFDTEIADTPTTTPIETPSSPEVYSISLSEVANGSIAEGYKSPPLGHILLGNIPFNLPSGQNSVTTQAELLPDFPLDVQLPVEIPAPKQVNLLITGGNMLSQFSGEQVGIIHLYFAQSDPILIPLIAGQNIREWKLLDEQTVSTISSPQVTEVWRTESNFGGTGIIDLLTIDLSGNYRTDKLISIKIIDTSSSILESKDPAINLLGVTVLGD